MPEHRRDYPRLKIQLRKRQMSALCLSIDQIRIGALLGLMEGAPSKHLDERREIFLWIGFVIVHESRTEKDRQAAQTRCFLRQRVALSGCRDPMWIDCVLLDLYLIGLWITPKWCPTNVHICYVKNMTGFVAGRSACSFDRSVLKSLQRAISGDALIPVKDS
jgi:hypothetical protein